MKNLLDKFKELNNKLDELDKTTSIVGYGEIQTTKEYEAVLKESQKVYNSLIKNGINPY